MCLRVCRRVSSPDMGMVVAVTDMAVVAVMGMGEAGRVPVVAVSDRLAVAGLFFLRWSGMQGGVSG